MVSFSSMSNSLSHSAANTMRPTNVRASVGSSTSGSSARPMRSVCAATGALRAPRPAPAQRRAPGRCRDGHVAILLRNAACLRRAPANRAAPARVPAWYAQRRSPVVRAAARNAACSASSRGLGAARRAAGKDGAGRLDLAPEMAGDRVPVGRRRAAASSSAQRGARMRAARAEAAARRRIDRARHVALEQDALAPSRRAPAPGSPTAAPACTGWRGAANSARLSAYSTILPRYITATRVAMCLTTARSWAMKM